ncbi:MAG: hypothetical protein RLZZ135_1078 [Cyanobacteriota bacterium]|jgi:uncharacterized protein YecE (DUF72 family)
MSISIGCAVWSYPGWMGEVYPPKTPTADFLRVYSNFFPAVEGNTTFYATPNQAIIDRWIAQTPPGFRFCLKFPRSITHHGLLEPSIPAARSFIAQMQGLGERLGVMFIQLPPHYAPDRLADLTAFLTALPRQDIDIALEVRHLDWFGSPHQEQLTELLMRLGIGRVILDTRSIYAADPDLGEIAQCKKPCVPLALSLTAPFSLIRYVSHPVRSANQVWLEEWANQIHTWLERDPQIYVFVHCPIEARSPINARYLHQIFTRSGITLSPLPPNPTADLPVQLKLF